MGSLQLTVERVCLWAIAALYLWGVQVMVWQQSGQGICLEVDSRCRKSFGENVVEESKGTVVCLSKLGLSPLPLRRALSDPSLQSQNSGSWPSSPWLWHSGTTPAKTVCKKKYY